jgi:hypothetical protein
MRRAEGTQMKWGGGESGRKYGKKGKGKEGWRKLITDE